MENPKWQKGRVKREIEGGINGIVPSSSIVCMCVWALQASAFEIIARTLIENCGGSSIKLLTELRAKHAEGYHSL